ncbi:MAG: hypothetical protein ACLTSG_07115 [Lachnospiraceae bacterium]
MKKSILAILLALVMVASLLPATALADEDWTEVSSAEKFSTALAAGGNIKSQVVLALQTRLTG